MAGHRFSKLEELEGRHPGLCRQVEAMLKAFISVRKIAAALEAQYGERVGYKCLYSYRSECWHAWRAEGIGSLNHRVICSSGRRDIADRVIESSGHRDISNRVIEEQNPNQPVDESPGDSKAESAAGEKAKSTTA